jgi:hypothetical protein
MRWSSTTKRGPARKDDDRCEMAFGMRKFAAASESAVTVVPVAPTPPPVTVIIVFNARSGLGADRFYDQALAVDAPPGGVPAGGDVEDGNLHAFERAVERRRRHARGDTFGSEVLVVQPDDEIRRRDEDIVTLAWMMPPDQPFNGRLAKSV